MTKKDFFRLIIKVFGLYSIVTSLFSVLPSTISTTIQQLDIYGIVYFAVVVGILFLLFVLLIKKADTLIRWFELDKGFDDERIEFNNFNAQNIIKLSSIIIGGLLIIDNIPSFLSHTYYAFKASNTGDSLDYKNNIYWATSGLNIIAGWFLVANFERVGKLLKADDK